MKTRSQLLEARNAVAARILMRGLSRDQLQLLCGMSIALCWADDAGGVALQRIVDGEPLDAGKTLENLPADSAAVKFHEKYVAE